MPEAPLSPALIDRIRVRVKDPQRRSDATSIRSQTVGLDAIFDSLGARGAQMRSVMMQITDLMGSAAPRLDALRGTTPIPIEDPSRNEVEPLPQPASEASLAACEEAIGRSLPAALRQLYSEVAEGGFGPGAGLFGLARLAEVYREMTDRPVGPHNQVWPQNLLPLVEGEPGYDCLDMSSGELVRWDPGEISGPSIAAWRRSFDPLARTLSSWLEEWLDHPSPGEWIAAAREEDRRKAKQGALQAILDYYSDKPSERAKEGLPEVGWEEEVRRRHPNLGTA